jgi:hypothetical protein
MSRNIDDIVGAYVEAALWAGLDWSGVTDEIEPRPLEENYGPEDLAPEALDAIRADVVSFVELAGALLDEWPDTDEQVGHDLFLTRNGHGAGFWDRYWGPGRLPTIGEALSDDARSLGESDLYVGDDGKLHHPDELMLDGGTR